MKRERESQKWMKVILNSKLGDMEREKSDFEFEKTWWWKNCFFLLFYFLVNILMATLTMHRTWLWKRKRKTLSYFSNYNCSAREEKIVGSVERWLSGRMKEMRLSFSSSSFLILQNRELHSEKAVIHDKWRLALRIKKKFFFNRIIWGHFQAYLKLLLLLHLNYFNKFRRNPSAKIKGRLFSLFLSLSLHGIGFGK